MHYFFAVFAAAFVMTTVRCASAIWIWKTLAVFFSKAGLWFSTSVFVLMGGGRWLAGGTPAVGVHHTH